MHGEATDEPDQPKLPRKSCLRISLRGLLLLLAVFACVSGWLGSHIQRARREQSIIAALTVAHGQSLNLVVANPFDADAKGEMDAFFEGGPPWLSDLLGADIFRTTVGLTCYARGNSFSSAIDENGKFYWRRAYVTGVTTEQMAMIAQLRYLKRLSLEANPVSDAGAAAIIKLKSLETLNLSHTAITDQALATLANVRSLRDLDVSYTDITDQAIDTLAKCQQLERLNIEAAQLSDGKVDWLKQQLPNCEIIQ